MKFWEGDVGLPTRNIRLVFENAAFLRFWDFVSLNLNAFLPAPTLHRDLIYPLSPQSPNEYFIEKSPKSAAIIQL